MGPKIDPWGTPQKRGAHDEEASPSITDKEPNRQIGDKPIQCHVHDTNNILQTADQDIMVHCIKGRAEVMEDKRIKIEKQPVSAASNKSLVSLTRAVSVLCREWKPDWDLI